jgi:glycosyltransferase involved in cell wall biosynthesis
LFFGHIGPYKGLEHLVAAFQQVMTRHQGYRLMVVGAPKVGSEKYWEDIRLAIRADASGECVIQKIEFIPDDLTEVYFKAADVLALPYTQAYQSGVLVLGYTFGLPVIAADVGSFKEDVIEGTTGFLCRPSDKIDLASTIEKYFESDLYKNLDRRRSEIRDYASARYSWDVVGEMTLNVYSSLLANGRLPEASQVLTP